MHLLNCFFCFVIIIIHDKDNDCLPEQEKYIGIILACKDKDQDIFSKIKGIVEHLLDSLNIARQNWLEIKNPHAWSDAKICAQLERDIGFVAKIDAKISQKIGIKTNVAAAQIKLGKLLELIKERGDKKYKEQNKYPQLTRDLAFVVDQKILYNDIRNTIINFNKLIKNIELFDVYQDKSLGNKKSLAFHIIYQADRTLINKEIDKIQEKLIKNLSHKFGAKIRNF